MSPDRTRHFEDPAAAQQRFLSLFLRSEREVFRYVAALVPNVADAEDIVQQTALSLWEKFDTYDASQPFTPWACRFALNKTRQWLERRQRWQLLISPGEAVCRSGRLTAEVPPQARGFRIVTPQMNVTDLGTVFGLEVKDRQTELHVFKGSVEFQSATGTAKQNLRERAGAVMDNSRSARLITANPAGFASLFDLQAKSVAAEGLRHEQWRAASSRLDEDPSLLVHFDFEQADSPDWRLHKAMAASGRGARWRHEACLALRQRSAGEREAAHGQSTVSHRRGGIGQLERQRFPRQRSFAHPKFQRRDG